MAKTKFAPFDAAEYLDNEEVIAEYLAAALEDPDPEVFMMAVSNVAKVRGIAKVARDSGLGRESLYKALAPGAKPRFETVRKMVDALGVRWTVARSTTSRRRAHAHPMTHPRKMRGTSPLERRSQTAD